MLAFKRLFLYNSIWRQANSEEMRSIFELGWLVTQLETVEATAEQRGNDYEKENKSDVDVNRYNGDFLHYATDYNRIL